MRIDNALVVDDEAHARDDLAYLLEASGRVKNVEAAASATDALVRLQESSFDILFLDIRMPGLDGIHFARTLQQFAQPPVIVFVSAHEDHAVEAFDVAAADYILKPVSAERIAKTLDRLEQRIGPPDIGAPPAPAPGPAAETSEELPFVAVEVAGKTLLIDRGEIRYVEAEGDYVRLHTRDDAYLIRASMSSIAARWASEGFVRVHRSYLINLRHVADISPSFNQTLIVRIKDAAGTRVPVSRRRARELRDRLGLSVQGS